MERLATGPHAAARTEVIWTVLRGEVARVARPLTALDVGGGSGGFAVPLAKDGHQVTVVDTSPNSLAALTRRACEAGVADRVRAVQGDADALADLVPASSVDLALCHSLLEVVDDPAEVLRALAGCLRPGGAVSVVVANRVAAVLARAVAGQFAAAAELLDDAGRRPGDPPRDPDRPRRPGGETDRQRRGFDIAEMSSLLGGAGLTVERIHGVRVVADLLPGVVAEVAADELVAFETRVSALPPYRDIATQLHLLARKPDS